MSERKDMKSHKMKTEKEETSLTRKSRKEGRYSEPTSDELMFRAWQKIYENRHKRLL